MIYLKTVVNIFLQFRIQVVQVELPWVPEAFLALFPVAAYVLYCAPHEKPLDQSAIALMTPSQWLACLIRFSPEFGSGC